MSNIATIIMVIIIILFIVIVFSLDRSYSKGGNCNPSLPVTPRHNKRANKLRQPLNVITENSQELTSEMNTSKVKNEDDVQLHSPIKIDMKCGDAHNIDIDCDGDVLYNGQSNFNLNFENSFPSTYSYTHHKVSFVDAEGSRYLLDSKLEKDMLSLITPTNIVKDTKLEVKYTVKTKRELEVVQPETFFSEF